MRQQIIRDVLTVALWAALAWIALGLFATIARAEPTQCPGGSCPTPAQPAHAQQRTAAPVAAVVVLEFSTAGEMGYTTGSIVEADGETAYILTCYHGWKPGAQITAHLTDGTKVPGTWVGGDPTWDVGVVSIADPKIAPLALADDEPQPGQPLNMAGWAKAKQFASARGKCLGYAAPDNSGQPDGFVRLSTHALQGQSGGPIYDDKGRIVGTITGYDPGTGTIGPCFPRIRRIIGRLLPPYRKRPRPAIPPPPSVPAPTPEPAPPPEPPAPAEPAAIYLKPADLDPIVHRLAKLEAEQARQADALDRLGKARDTQAAAVAQAAKQAEQAAADTATLSKATSGLAATAEKIAQRVAAAEAIVDRLPNADKIHSLVQDAAAKIAPQAEPTLGKGLLVGLLTAAGLSTPAAAIAAALATRAARRAADNVATVRRFFDRRPEQADAAAHATVAVYTPPAAEPAPTSTPTSTPTAAPPAAASEGPDVLRLPTLPLDYARVWADHFVATGGNLRHEALRRQLYREAVELLRQGKINTPANGPAVADAIDQWVTERFFDRVSKGDYPDENIYHNALMGFLYRAAIERLRAGDLPILGYRETADAIDQWVRREFLNRLQARQKG